MEIQSILEDAGAEVVGPANTLDEALEVARCGELTAAFLDMRLGRASITPVARLLRERGIPFLFYSGQPLSDPTRAEWPDTIIISKPATAWQLVDGAVALLRAQVQTNHQANR